MCRQSIMFTAAVLVGLCLTVPTSAQFNLLPNGMVGDGQPDFVYDPATGNITLEMNPCVGFCDFSGHFRLESESGVFTGEAAMLPAGGLFPVDTDFEIAKAAFDSQTSLDLGKVAPPGLSAEFLLDDIVTAWVISSPGGDMLSLTLLPAAPTGIGTVLAASVGDGATHQFQPAGGEDSLGFGAPQWSDLVFSGDMGQAPALPPMLTEEGLFTWDTTGSPTGNYTATATVTNSGGSATASLSITVQVPEPGSVVLALLTVLTFGARVRRGS